MSSEPQAVTHQAMEVRHRDELEWETIRWPGETGKMMFHPRPERPTEPNAGILKLEPGGHHPLHKHDFAQVWYVLEGTFKIGAHECGPGSMSIGHDETPWIVPDSPPTDRGRRTYSSVDD